MNPDIEGELTSSSSPMSVFLKDFNQMSFPVKTFVPIDAMLKQLS